MAIDLPAGPPALRPAVVAARAPAHASPRPRSPRSTSTTSSTSSTRCAPGADLRGRIVVGHRRRPPSPPPILVKPGRDWAGHVPGQYVRVGVDVDGVRLWRTYSLTHGPRPDRHLSITVKAIPDGVVSNHLVHRAQAGQMLQLEQAEGEFVLPQPIPRQAAAGHRRLRHHPGDRDAAQPVLARRTPVRRPTSCSCTSTLNESTAIFRDELRAHGRPRPDPADRAVRRRRTACSTSPTSTSSSPTSRAAHLRLRPGRPARRARGAPRRPRPRR